ncbi:hypothetical protein CHL76_05090 [Marinococcus halophilus]|uniref:Penicillin-binding protein 4 n=1 Tax=Marinococcus halophilus TaxID=1371 RepID=A0A510Y671_MARHA|nr:transglycosylase domain-containing protein [Marinococcus halophilus]OZT81145.1 hypothetical protein CHL76_05090 [Marinococcus halophilus]GEK58869.1 penicillin-binding protein 4 [Marinococcus halophilus]
MRKLLGLIWILLFITSGAVVSWLFIKELSSTQALSSFLEEQVDVSSVPIAQNSYVTDHKGDQIAEYRTEEDRRYVSLSHFPEHARAAFIATEDQKFYEHQGVDPLGVLRALISNASTGSIEEGASTITQQATRNIYFSHQQTYERKVAEVLFAYQLEQSYTKNEILEMYMNTIYFGEGIYGFETASHSYFGRPSSDLSLAQTAFLAAVPANPSYYNPVEHPERTRERQLWILEKMNEAEVITAEEKMSASEETVSVDLQERNANPYPDYTDYVKHEFKQLVAQNEGWDERLNQAEGSEKEALSEKLNIRTNQLLQSGITIHTTMDTDIQNMLIEKSRSYWQQRGIEGAAVIIDHRAGTLTAMSGGADYHEYEFNRAFQAYRQPGSVWKPLLVYGPYLEEHERSIHQLVSTKKYCVASYCPANEGGAAKERVTIKSALAFSYNTSALRLMHQTGLEASFQYLEKFEWAELTPADRQYAAALGGVERGVSPVELTSAYTVFSNDGTYEPPRAITSVTDADGKLLFEWESQETTVWSPETNDQMREVLRATVVSGTASSLAGFADVSGKTGTSNATRDSWFAGYDDRYTVGVWHGYDDPRPLPPDNSAIAFWKTIYPMLYEKNEQP